LIHELHKLFQRHLSDDDLTLLVTGDLAGRRQTWADQHLAVCVACRARRDRFGALFSQVTAYHAHRAEVYKLNNRAQRARLVELLNQMPDDAPSEEVAQFEQVKDHVGALLPMNPILVTGLILAVASITCVFVWMQQSRADITSNTLLVRAEAWDPVASHDRTSGVIRQTVKIAMEKRILRRTIYRDAQGKRRPIEQKPAQDEYLLKQRLAEAEISWDAPLSATSYQDWHDAQRVRKDRVQRTGDNLLVLTTTTPDGNIAAQSLTVRDTDFHPVLRTVSYRDSETVEIAELDYSVLPWNSAISSLFQPEQEMRETGMLKPQSGFVPLPLPVLSEEQLNDVELSARLTLNRLHADAGEQIEVARGPRGVEIRGITDTEKRKHQLEVELHMLPHVTASISSIEELKARPSQAGELSRVNVIEMQTQTTPLETYYLARGRGIAPLGGLAQRLFNSADAIGFECRTIDDLQRRFAYGENISTIGSAALADLLFTHKHKLLAALKDEEHLLANAQIGTSHSKPVASANGTDMALTSLAERNLALIRELALGKGGSDRCAEMIASELTASLNELNLKAHEVQVVQQNSTKLDKRK
jgi:hypothetical protein